MSTLRAAIYAHVSSDQRAQQDMIASQIADLRRRVSADGLGLDDDLCFIDDGVLWRHAGAPALDRLRDVAHAGGLQRLYVHSSDRLAPQVRVAGAAGRGTATQRRGVGVPQPHDRRQAQAIGA